jgi:hypothetical protein
MKRTLAIWVAVLAGGCVPNAVHTPVTASLDAAVASPRLELVATGPDAGAPKIGPQKADKGSINVGSVVVQGGAVAWIALATVAAVWLWRRGAGYKAATDVLVEQNFARGISEDEKQKIELEARRNKAEPTLNRRVKKIKATLPKES